jgi:hypothetical protein
VLVALVIYDGEELFTYYVGLAEDVINTFEADELLTLEVDNELLLTFMIGTATNEVDLDFAVFTEVGGLLIGLTEALEDIFYVIDADVLVGGVGGFLEDSSYWGDSEDCDISFPGNTN